VTTEEEDVETKMSGNIRPCCRASDQDEVQSEGKCRSLSQCLTVSVSQCLTVSHWEWLIVEDHDRG